MPCLDVVMSFVVYVDIHFILQQTDENTGIDNLTWNRFNSLRSVYRTV